MVLSVPNSLFLCKKMLFYKLVSLVVITFVEITTCEEELAERLLNRYHDESNECFSPQNEPQPLYACSGIIIRGVNNCKPGVKYAWSLKPNDKLKNSFAMAFLRSDHAFSELGKGYDAGFIIYPHLSTPSQKNPLKMLCAFPIDARTDRRDDRGCGRFKNDETGWTRQCDAQNITNFQDWLTHYNQILSSADPRLTNKQCGFDLTKETATQNFATVLRANTEIKKNPEYAIANNELRVEGWNENNTKQIPIEAFFYFIGSENGLAIAMKYQHDFFTQSGEMVPIVGIRLPSAANPDIYMTQHIEMNSTNIGKIYSRGLE